MKGTRPRPWVVVSDYPAWPSPYFTELERHAPRELRLEFAPDLAVLERRPEPPGVVNLHRLKRLYRDRNGRRTPEAVAVMLHRLEGLRSSGWRLVWTVHNLLPIDGGVPGEADHRAAHGVLALADAVITHTHADARHLATVTDAPITVGGWAGLTAPEATTPPSADVRGLVSALTDAPSSVLVLGNLTAYKGLLPAVDAFTAHTRTTHLFLAGPCSDPALARTLREVAADTGSRVHVHTGRIPAEHVHLLYRAADTAWCPYRTDGAWEFFTKVLHPSSVGTAVAFGTPVIAPELPAITEMTTGHPRLLYPPRHGPGPALAAHEATTGTPPVRRPRDGTSRWRSITASYAHLAQTLAADEQRQRD
ncbi:hypothetical protein BJF83_20245 [Nocardiopsis sp. CNR-923]|uniref:glycosyltransferase n=1 Tax=Nocardiopsis sp. CNR-923 TaxID=1904965 RepID=UPI00095B2F3D|nr:glycosyltransferase [Nocardiopsis sp. CNR-923]OLT26837.1 hypothetical protein BJF83_20245 [Nocardiopsis sp. CNR-923]